MYNLSLKANIALLNFWNGSFTEVIGFEVFFSKTYSSSNSEKNSSSKSSSANKKLGEKDKKRKRQYYCGIHKIP